VLRYQGLAFRTAFLILGDAAEAEDVIQEAFLKAYRTLPRFRRGWPFRPWLLKIVANEARNRQRAAGRRSQLEERLGESRPKDDAAPSPEAAALLEERREVLLHAVNSLARMDRLVIACRYFLDLSEEEMASVLDCPRGTVKSTAVSCAGTAQRGPDRDKGGCPRHGCGSGL
jgi:RNA polymerase sigma factor (sigma-70 family)